MQRLLRKSRGAIALAVVLAAATVSAALGLNAYYHRLPDPATADREGLFRWMVLRDVSQEPPTIQATLLKRLQQELRMGVDLSQVNDQVEGERLAQFWENVDYLLEQFWLEKTAAFHATPPSERPAFVHAQIDDLLQWEYVKSLRAGYAAKGSESQLLTDCERRIAPWRAKAAPEKSQQMNELFIQAQADLMLRYWQGEL